MEKQEERGGNEKLDQDQQRLQKLSVVSEAYAVSAGLGREMTEMLPVELKIEGQERKEEVMWSVARSRAREGFVNSAFSFEILIGVNLWHLEGQMKRRERFCRLTMLNQDVIFEQSFGSLDWGAFKTKISIH